MRLLGYNGNKVFGIWKDGNNNEFEMGFNYKWGEHVFSTEEIEALLEGQHITFYYKYGTLTGHLQYGNVNEGPRYFGFFPTNNPQYIPVPKYEDLATSYYYGDRKKEMITNHFMRMYYYARLFNLDGSEIKKEYNEKPELQKLGIDVKFIRNNIEYIIDEKAQLDYIKSPLDSFTMELYNSNSGNIGWFLNNKLLNNYYMFIWPKADMYNIKSVDDINSAKYALVNCGVLKHYIETNYQNLDALFEDAKKISQNKLEGTYVKYNKRYKKLTPYSEDVYLVYTMKPTDENGKKEDGKKEEPVNLLVKKWILDSLAEDKGELFKS